MPTHKKDKQDRNQTKQQPGVKSDDRSSIGSSSPGSQSSGGQGMTGSGQRPDDNRNVQSGKDQKR